MFYEQTFNEFSILWKTLIVIGSITIVVFLILLAIIVSLMLESKTKKDQDQDDLSEYDDFLNEFTNGKKEIEEYPSLPRIKDLDGNILKNLMQIDIL